MDTYNKTRYNHSAPAPKTEGCPNMLRKIYMDTHNKTKTERCPNVEEHIYGKYIWTHTIKLDIITAHLPLKQRAALMLRKIYMTRSPGLET